MYVVMTGQLFYAGSNEKAGPLFSIRSLDRNSKVTYEAALISTSGTLIEYADNFATIAEAVTWLYDRADY